MRNILTLAILFFYILDYQTATARTAAQYLKKSEAFWSMGLYDSALRYAWLAEPLVADSTTRNSKEYAYFTGQYFSMNHEGAGNMDSATYWYRFSLNMFESFNDTASNEYGETLANYGNMLNTQGYYTEAQPYLQRAVSVMQNHRENVDAYLGSLNNLGNYYNYCGAYANAIRLYSECLDSLNQHQNNINYLFRIGVLLQNLATLYTKIGDVQEADSYYEKACAFFKKTRNLNGYYEARKNYGNLYLLTRDTSKAEKLFIELYNDSLLSTHTGSNAEDFLSWKHAEAIIGLGEVREMQQHYKDAEKLYRQSQAIAQQLTDKRALVSSQICIAHLYTLTNRRLAADSLYETLFGQLLKKNTYDHFSYFTAYTAYCENLVMLNRLPEAFGKVKYLSELLFADLQNNFPGMTEDNQMNYLVSLNNYKNLLAALADNFNQQEEANEVTSFVLNRRLQLKGMILTYQQRRLQSLRFSQDKTLTALAKEWMSTKEKLYSSYNTSVAPPIIDSLERLARRYEQDIAIKMGTPPENISDSLTAALSNRLSVGEAAIEFVRYRKGEGTEARYGAFVLRQHASPVFIKLCTESRLNACFKTKHFATFNTEHQLKNGQLIDDLVWKSLSSQLKNITRVYYSPDGLLNYLSFDALPGAKPNTSLLQDVDLVQLYNLRSLLNAAHTQNETATVAVLWGNIDCSEKAYKSPAISYTTPNPDSLPLSVVSSIKGGPGPDGFKPLMSEELDTIKKIIEQKAIPVTVYDSINATEENFKHNAASFSGWLHISSHGFYATNPTAANGQQQYVNRFNLQVNPLLRCGLALRGANYTWSGAAPLPGREDGILTGYETAMMDLSKVKLVVLSACETGLGDIDAGSEGVLGLQRAFRLAGINKMVISLWNVNAKATKQLMAAFYQKLTGGSNPATALRNAKLQMAKKKNLPYDWAGFVLVE